MHSLIQFHHMSLCVDSLIPSKSVVIFPKNKPWVAKHLKSIINRNKNIVFTLDLQEKKAVSGEVRTEIAKSKHKYKDNIGKQFTNVDLRSVCQGIKTMVEINQHGHESKQLIRVNGVQDNYLLATFSSFFFVL